MTFVGINQHVYFNLSKLFPLVNHPKHVTIKPSILVRYVKKNIALKC